MMDPALRACLRGVWLHLDANRLSEAGALLRGLPIDQPHAVNARAVLALRTGNVSGAMGLLRKVVFPDDGIIMDPDADPAWCANFCLALLRSGLDGGFRTYVSQLDPASHPAIGFLMSATAPRSAAPGDRSWMGRLFSPHIAIRFSREIAEGWPETCIFSACEFRQDGRLLPSATCARDADHPGARLHVPPRTQALRTGEADHLDSFGHTGARIAAVQHRLVDLGFDPGPVDGIFGGGTRAAVRQFQSHSGIAADGIVGPITRALLFRGSV